MLQYVRELRLDRGLITAARRSQYYGPATEPISLKEPFLLSLGCVALKIGNYY
jgi:hypothetical protein